jgi:hypothetical protein
MPPTDTPDDGDVTTGETAGPGADDGGDEATDTDAAAEDTAAASGATGGNAVGADQAPAESSSETGGDTTGTGDASSGATGGGAADADGDGVGSRPSTLAERRQQAAADATGQRVDWGRTAKRYGPFVAVVVLVAAAIAVFGGGGGGDGGDGPGGGGIAIPDEDTLVSSGPMTWQRAEAEGREVDFGPNCDTATGRIELPTVYAPPCVEPFEGDNGGTTSMGVTAEEVLIVRYTANADAADPQSVSALLDAGVDANPQTMAQALDNYVALYNQVFETYGRTVRVEEFIGSGAGNDREAARADAVEIAEMEPFAVVGGPWESGDVFATELAARGVICGPACTLAEPDSVIEEFYPYLWLPGPTTDQGAQLVAEMVSKLAGPGPAEMAGDPELQEQERSYALLHYDTPEGDFSESFEDMRDALSDAGIELTTDIEYELDLANAQENARTIISRLKGEGVTTIIFTGEPLTPMSLTATATAQDYHPEWIVGPTVFGEYTAAARLLDGEQWSHGFGMSWSSARVEPLTGDAATIYRWAFGEDVPNRLALLSEGTLRWAFQGIHLAGPDLTPQTFRDAIFRTPPAGGGPTAPHVSIGDHGIWDEPDLGSVDDLTLLWWDPDATGVDEVGQEGQGMYRYANRGARYRPGEIPDSLEDAGLFDEASSILLYDQRPPEDVPPTDYPPPNLG